MDTGSAFPAEYGNFWPVTGNDPNNMSDASKQPNIVIFMPDEQRWSAVGYAGNDVIKTPNMDRLAAEGTPFSNCFVTHTVCTPSRISMFTGWYPHVSGHRTLWYMLRNHEPNGLRYLKQAGYHVEWWGKNDLLAPDSFPSSVSHRGEIEIERGKMMANPWPVDDQWRRTLYYGERPAANSNDMDRQWIDGAIEFLNSDPPEPFCLYLPLFFPHPPYWVEEPYFSMYDRDEMPAPIPVNGHKGKPAYYPEIHQSYDLDKLSEEQYREIVAVYYGMISRLDDQLGELREALERNGLADQTATMFFSDHGDYVGDYGLTEKWPTGYEDNLIRVPMVVHAPWLEPQPMNDELVEIIDVLPRMLDIAGIELGHDQFGKSLMPIVKGEEVELRDAVFCEGGHGDYERLSLELVDGDSDPDFIYYEKGRIQTDNPDSVCKASMVRTRKWRYIRRAADTDELYDMENDPAELENLVDRPEHAGVRHELERRLVQRYLETADVVPYDKDPRF